MTSARMFQDVGRGLCPELLGSGCGDLAKLLSISELQCFSLFCSMEIYHSAYSVSPSSKNLWHTLNAGDGKEMSQVHFLTQKGNLLSLNVITRVQQIIDRIAMKFMIRQNIIFTPIWVFAVRVESGRLRPNKTGLLSRARVCVALLMCIVITVSCF